MEREYLSMEGSKTAAAVSDAIISAPGFIAPHVHCPCLAIHLFIIIIISFNGNRNSERERESEEINCLYACPLLPSLN